MSESAIQTGPGHAWLCAAIPAGVALLSCGGLYWVGQAGWPGETGVSATVFCERLREGIVKQPANCWSNIGFVSVGIFIGFRAMRDHRARSEGAASASNRMQSGVFLPILYASLAVLLGPGSAAMHASTTEWGAKLDVISMFIWISFGLAYAISRLRDLSTPVFGLLYLALAVPLSLGVLADALPINVDLTFGLLIVGMVVLEVLLAGAAPGFRETACGWSRRLCCS
jgi:hypothetical protein